MIDRIHMSTECASYFTRWNIKQFWCVIDGATNKEIPCVIKPDWPYRMDMVCKGLYTLGF